MITRKSAALFTALLALSGAIGMDLAPVAAATKADTQAINAAGMQRALTQKMCKQLLLAVLGVDAADNLAHLEASRRQFGETQAGLRSGDPALGLPDVPDAEILQALSAVDELWPVFDAVLGKGLGADAKATAEVVARVETVELALLAATDKVTDAYQKAAAGRTFSMLAVTFNSAARQRMLLQKISKEFLLIAYGHEVEQNRRNLKQSAADFDATLKALMKGDAERFVMTPPNLDIRTQLAQVYRHWRDFLTPITAVAEGAEIDAGMIELVAGENPPLVEAVRRTVTLYQGL
jgi:hypothetical protein